MRAWLGGAGVLVCLLAVAPVAAQDDTERARALFAEGLQLADQGQWAQAAEKFRATMRLRQSPAIAYNLAVALEQLGQLGEAAGLLETVVEDPEADRTMKRNARTLLRSVERRVGRLTITVQSDIAGARIRIDDREITADQLGRPIAVDPRAHTVVLMRGTRVVERREVTVAEGGRAEVTLGRSDTAVAPSPGDAARAGGEGEGEGEGDAIGDGGGEGEGPGPLDEEVPDDGSRDEGGDGGGGVLTRWWLWAVIGAVVVVGVGGALIATSGGDPDPVQGNLMPGVIDVQVMP